MTTSCSDKIAVASKRPYLRSLKASEARSVSFGVASVTSCRTANARANSHDRMPGPAIVVPTMSWLSTRTLATQQLLGRIGADLATQTPAQPPGSLLKRARTGVMWVSAIVLGGKVLSLATTFLLA